MFRVATLKLKEGRIGIYIQLYVVFSYIIYGNTILSPDCILLNIYKLKSCLKKNVAKNVDRVKFKGTITKWPSQKISRKHATQQGIRDI